MIIRQWYKSCLIPARWEYSIFLFFFFLYKLTNPRCVSKRSVPQVATIKMRFQFLTPLSFAALSSAAPTEDIHPLPAVKTSSGTFTGFVNTSSSSVAPDVNQWLGVPFAQPPVGSLRFMPPQKLVSSGITNAISYKPICPQQSGDPPKGVFWELVPEFQNRDPQSEDCLYLNIWGPRKPVSVTNSVSEKKNKKKEKKKLVPVIIWVCGGGFREGGGHAAYQVPDQWIQRTQTHMVVAFNYRLNLFGFPGADGLNGARNPGLMDIRMAVEWLRDNVASFGGDPKRMVLYGQSAGANAVWSYGYSYPENPIVSGLIASSGGINAINPTTNSAFHDLAQGVGCADLGAKEELECVQRVDWQELKRVVLKENYSFRPIADGITYFANHTERLEKGLIAKVVSLLASLVFVCPSINSH